MELYIAYVKWWENCLLRSYIIWSVISMHFHKLAIFCTKVINKNSFSFLHGICQHILPRIPAKQHFLIEQPIKKIPNLHCKFNPIICLNKSWEIIIFKENTALTFVDVTSLRYSHAPHSLLEETDCRNCSLQLVDCLCLCLPAFSFYGIST